MDDFVRVGGLAAVSAALPRALRSRIDVRVLLPGYRDVIEQITHIEIIGRCAAMAEMPAATLGRAATRDGLPVYVLLCPQLYDRPGNPYGDEHGRDWPDNDIRFGRLAAAADDLDVADLFDDVPATGQQNADVDFGAECARQRGRDGGEPAHADEVVHFRRDKENLQEMPLGSPDCCYARTGPVFQLNERRVTGGTLRGRRFR